MSDVLRVVLTLGWLAPLITFLFLVWRARVQPIRYDTDVVSINVDDAQALKVLVKTENDELVTPRFFIAKVTIENRSNKDLDEFEFQLTLPLGVTAVEVGIAKPDDSHEAEVLSDSAKDPLDFPKFIDEEQSRFIAAMERIDNPKPQALRFRVKPFNRWKPYTINLTAVPMVIDGGQFRSHSDRILGSEELKPTAAVVGVNLVPVPFKRLRASGSLLTRGEAGGRSVARRCLWWPKSLSKCSYAARA